MCPHLCTFSISSQMSAHNCDDAGKNKNNFVIYGAVSTILYFIKLDAESRKLRALESRGAPELSAFERSEDATKGPGPQGALMRVAS